jgi:hypothetical protein
VVVPTDISSGSDEDVKAWGGWFLLGARRLLLEWPWWGAGNNFYGAQPQRPRLSDATLNSFGFFSRERA